MLISRRNSMAVTALRRISGVSETFITISRWYRKRIRAPERLVSSGETIEHRKLISHRVREISRRRMYYRKRPAIFSICFYAHFTGSRA